MKQEFLKGVAGTIRLMIYSDNIVVVPASGTITLYTPSGGVLQASTAVTVGASGEMTYALTATHTATKDLNYKAIWAYVVSGVTYYQTQLFDIVLSILAIPITDDDLFNELDSLRKAANQSKGTATAGAVGSITDTRRQEADNYWKGGTVEIVSGTGVNQKRSISAFTQSTGVFVITPNWGTTPDTTSIYVAIKSFTNKIQASFEKLSTMLYDKGKRDSLIMESSQISVPLVYLSIHMIALDLMDESDDKWARLATIYWDKFQQSFNNMKLDYDEDESGTVTEDEEQQSQTSLRVGRA